MGALVIFYITAPFLKLGQVNVEGIANVNPSKRTECSLETDMGSFRKEKAFLWSIAYEFDKNAAAFVGFFMPRGSKTESAPLDSEHI